MERVSYLLALDGSAESMNAAHLAWELAEKSKGKVVAQHVIDVGAAWRFLSHSSNGFIGNGAYIGALESIKEALYSVSELLMLSYTSQTEGHSIQSETHVDEGDTIDEIVNRSKDNDYLVIGHRGALANGFRAQTKGLSVAYELLKRSQCPVLMVQGKHELPKIDVYMPEGLRDSASIQKVMDWATMFGLEPVFYHDGQVSVSRVCHEAAMPKSSEAKILGSLEAAVLAAESGACSELDKQECFDI